MELEDKRLELRVGLFIVTGLVLLVLMIYLFHGFAVRGSVYIINATFPFGGGIQKGTPVMVAGYNVGSVRSVRWDSKDQIIRAALQIDSSCKIKEDAVLVVDSKGMLGETYLEFTPGSLDRPNLKPGSTVHGKVPPTMTQMKVESMTMIQKITVAVSEIGDLASRLNKATDALTGQINDRGEQAGSVMAEAEGLLKELRESNKKLNEGLENIADISLKIREGDGTIHKLLYEKELYDRANEMVVDAGKATRKMAELAEYLKENPSDIVWGPEPIWYKRWWRGMRKWWSRDDEDEKKGEKRARPSRRGERRGSRKYTNLQGIQLKEAPARQEDGNLLGD